MADRIAVMDQGRILQVAPPRRALRAAQLPHGRRLHRHDEPVSRPGWSMRGAASAGGRERLGELRFELPGDGGRPRRVAEVGIAVRPEKVRLSHERPPGGAGADRAPGPGRPGRLFRRLQPRLRRDRDGASDHLLPHQQRRRAQAAVRRRRDLLGRLAPGRLHPADLVSHDAPSSQSRRADQPRAAHHDLERQLGPPAARRARAGWCARSTRTCSACRRPRSATSCSRRSSCGRSASSTSCCTASPAITASRSSRRCRSRTPRRLDWCGKIDCRHAVAMLPGGIELHNLYVPAGGDLPDPRAQPEVRPQARLPRRADRLVPRRVRAPSAAPCWSAT